MKELKLKICKIHGETEYRQEGTKNRFRCIKCASLAVKKRRTKLKELAVEYKGGCCEFCGYSKIIEVLEFHHKDPSEKDFGIAEKGKTRDFQLIKNELDKCLMLCANCHREEHVRLRDFC